MDFRTEADFTSEGLLDVKGQITEDDNGDLIIEGYASDWGMDDQDELFEPGAFDRGIKSFLATNPVLLFHHKGHQVLGQVLELNPDEHGLYMKARVDKPASDTDWGVVDVFNKIQRTTIRGLSVAGRFRRRRGADGKARIWDAGIREISVTPLPVNPRTMFRVATKAFGDDPADEKYAGILDAVDALNETLEAANRAADKVVTRDPVS